MRLDEIQNPVAQLQATVKLTLVACEHTTLFYCKIFNARIFFSLSRRKQAWQGLLACLGTVSVSREQTATIKLRSLPFFFLLRATLQLT